MSFNNLRSALFAAVGVISLTYGCTDGPVVDMWQMKKSAHVFGYWNSFSDAYKKRMSPVKYVTLPIMPNGNYPGDPSPWEFMMWLVSCKQDVSNFTQDAYDKRFLTKEK